MKRLIINADDFGLHPVLNKGIIRAYQQGCLTSTTLMCSAPAFEEAVELAKQEPGLGVGIHLTLVGGVAPVLPPEQVPTLVDARGLFPADYIAFAQRFYTGKVQKKEIWLELCAQVERAQQTGLQFTHLDSHQHMHVLPGMLEIVIALCQKYGFTKLRVPAESYTETYGYQASAFRQLGRAGLSWCARRARGAFKEAGLSYPEHFFGMLSGGNLNLEVVKNYLLGYSEGCAEIMTHPGDSNQELAQAFPWAYHWEQERDVWLSPELSSMLQTEGIKLINFGGL